MSRWKTPAGAGTTQTIASVAVMIGVASTARTAGGGSTAIKPARLPVNRHLGNNTLGPSVEVPVSPAGMPMDRRLGNSTPGPSVSVPVSPARMPVNHHLGNSTLEPSVGMPVSLPLGYTAVSRRLGKSTLGLPVGMPVSGPMGHGTARLAALNAAAREGRRT